MLPRKASSSSQGTFLTGIGISLKKTREEEEEDREIDRGMEEIRKAIEAARREAFLDHEALPVGDELIEEGASDSARRREGGRGAAPWGQGIAQGGASSSSEPALSRPTSAGKGFVYEHRPASVRDSRPVSPGDGSGNHSQHQHEHQHHHYGGQEEDLGDDYDGYGSGVGNRYPGGDQGGEEGEEDDGYFRAGGSGAGGTITPLMFRGQMDYHWRSDPLGERTPSPTPSIESVRTNVEHQLETMEVEQSARRSELDQYPHIGK